MKKNLCLTFSLFCFQTLFSQNINPQLLKSPWQAYWVAHPSAPLREYGVFHFRKAATFGVKPTNFIIHISADTRYKLFVNGKQIGLGPARSDLAHWKFDTYDLAPFLKAGRNVLAVLVWNQGIHNAYAQHSDKTALIVQGNSDNEKEFNTDKTWLVLQDAGYQPIVFEPNDKRLLYQYYVAGATDSLRANAYPWGWEESNFQDNKWLRAKQLNPGCPPGLTNPEKWTLTPRHLDYPELTQQRFPKLARHSGAEVDGFFLQQPVFWTIPPKTRISFLVDNQTLTTGFPTLEISGGKDSYIKMTYAEGLAEEKAAAQFKFIKNNRSEITGKKIFGTYDVWLPDGGENRFFQPLAVRTFRYLQVEIETHEQPLVIKDLYHFFSAYPLKPKATFESEDAFLKQLWETAWRTQRLCTQETYMDCPYYEQMQYIGDARIQALTDIAVTGDDRLMRNALQQFYQSVGYEGLTMSRYPSELPQYAPLYSLCWLLMVNDYWLYRQDENFVEEFVPAMLRVLEWFESRINAQQMLGRLPYLDFLDSHYPGEEILKKSKNPSLTPNTLFYVYAMEQTAPLLRRFNRNAEADKYLKLAQTLKKSVMEKCYDPARQLFADHPDKMYFSQHANLLAVLTDIFPEKARQTALVQEIFKNKTLIPCDTYFRFYLFRAMKKTGLAEEIHNQWGDWKAMLDNQMTTFGEWRDDPRSDCHAWSAYPVYELLTTVLGVEPAEPGFKTVKIEPALGSLPFVNGIFPHPKGNILIKYDLRQAKTLLAEITLPDGVSGNFFWKGKNYPLKSGQSKLTIYY
jgi:alpha-L-rhamnosidase